MSARWRFCVAKLGRARFLSHLDLMRTMARAFRRAEIDLTHSAGFHPHPLLSFGPALAVGLESQSEYFDATMDMAGDGPFAARLNAVLPEGLVILADARLSVAGPSLAALLNAASYRVWVGGSPEALARASGLGGAENLSVVRGGAQGATRVVDLRPLLIALEPRGLSAGFVDVLGVTGSGGNLRPEELLRLVPGLAIGRVLRTGLFHREGESLREPISGAAVNWKEIHAIGE